MSFAPLAHFSRLDSARLELWPEFFSLSLFQARNKQVWQKLTSRESNFTVCCYLAKQFGKSILKFQNRKKIINSILSTKKLYHVLSLNCIRYISVQINSCFITVRVREFESYNRKNVNNTSQIHRILPVTRVYCLIMIVLIKSVNFVDLQQCSCQF